MQSFSLLSPQPQHTLHIYIYEIHTSETHLSYTYTYTSIYMPGCSWKMCGMSEWLNVNGIVVGYIRGFLGLTQPCISNTYSLKVKLYVIRKYKTSCSLPTKHQLLSRAFVWAEENVNCYNPCIHCMYTSYVWVCILNESVAHLRLLARKEINSYIRRF